MKICDICENLGKQIPAVQYQVSILETQLSLRNKKNVYKYIDLCNKCYKTLRKTIIDVADKKEIG